MVRKATRLPNGARISDHVSLGVLTATVPAALVDAVLADTGRQSQRQRQLPARLVVYYVMALALYAQSSYGEVLRCLLEGVRWLRLGGAELALATSRPSPGPVCGWARRRCGSCSSASPVPSPPRGRPGPGIAAADWSVWTAPPSICRTRLSSRRAMAGQAPHAGPAASRSCGC